MLTHNALVFTQHQVGFDRLPSAFDGFRIVQISDLHFFQYTDPNFYQDVVDQIMAFKPDLIAMTGDTVHYGNQHVAVAHRFLSQLQAPSGCFAVLGNHDYYDDHRSQDITSMLKEAGFTLLKNSHHKITAPKDPSQHFWLCGLDDYWQGSPCIQTAISEIPTTTDFTLMMVHNPLLFDPIALFQNPDQAGHIDWVIAGHTHAGHVFIPWLQLIYRQIFKMKYRYGWYRKNKSQLYVTSGVGSAAFYFKGILHQGQKKYRFALPRFRYNTHPEIAAFSLVSNGPKTPNKALASVQTTPQ